MLRITPAAYDAWYDAVARAWVEDEAARAKALAPKPPPWKAPALRVVPPGVVVRVEADRKGEAVEITNVGDGNVGDGNVGDGNVGDGNVYIDAPAPGLTSATLPDETLVVGTLPDRTIVIGPLPEPRPKPARRKQSPFQFGQAVLEPVRTTLFDTIDLVPESRLREREPASGSWNAHTRTPFVGEMRFFTDPVGKDDTRIHPAVRMDGQLPAPRLFVLDGLRIAFQVQRLNETEDYNPVVGRTDIERIKAVSGLRLQIGVANYFDGTPATLPYHCRSRRICIPCRQLFFVEWRLTEAVPLAYAWRLTVKLDGELGVV